MLLDKNTTGPMRQEEPVYHEAKQPVAPYILVWESVKAAFVVVHG